MSSLRRARTEHIEEANSYLTVHGPLFCNESTPASLEVSSETKTPLKALSATKLSDTKTSVRCSDVNVVLEDDGMFFSQSFSSSDHSIHTNPLPLVMCLERSNEVVVQEEAKIQTIETSQIPKISLYCWFAGECHLQRRRGATGGEAHLKGGNQTCEIGASGDGFGLSFIRPEGVLQLYQEYGSGPLQSGLNFFFPRLPSSQFAACASRSTCPFVAFLRANARVPPTHFHVFELF